MSALSAAVNTRQPIRQRGPLRGRNRALRAPGPRASRGRADRRNSLDHTDSYVDERYGTGRWVGGLSIIHFSLSRRVRKSFFRCLSLVPLFYSSVGLSLLARDKNGCYVIVAIIVSRPTVS
eukprot:scaffold25828_cov48-Attheya_sp.AAC.4